MNDIKFAVRQLLKSPAFSALAIVTLAIGIGMNTAIFTLINDLFLHALPYDQPERVLHVYQEDKSRNIEQGPMSVPKFWHYRDAQTVFSDFAADAGTGFILTGIGDPLQINGDNVTANYLPVLGVKPIMGRLFRADEESKADVAVVTQHFWKSRLSNDPNVIGRSITLNGVATTIIGVIPTQPIAWFGPDTDVFTCKPFELPGTPKELIMRGISYMRAIGRLKPGVSVDQAKANLAAVAQSYRQANSEKADASWTPQLVTMPEDVTGNLRPAFITLVAAVAVVLLIACSNVANLLLVRFTSRKREISLRVALGASRAGLVRLFVIESTLISFIAGAAGICFALWTLPLIPKILGANAQLPTPNALNVPVLLFTLAISLLTGIAMGAYPALQSSKSDLVEGLKEGGRGTSGSIAQQRFRRALVGAQVCLSIVLLTGAALLMTSFVRLANEKPGFRLTKLWGCGIALPPSRYPDKAAYARFAERLQHDMQSAPGVENVAIGDGVPLLGNNASTPYSRADRNLIPLNQRPLGLNHSISPGYLKAFSIPLIAGRDFDEHDRLDSQPVVLISQSTAKRLFPNEDPLGHQMFFGTDNGTGLLTTIVGVVGDIRYRSLDKTDDVEFYRPIQQRIFPFIALIVQSSMPADALVRTTRSILSKIDPELPIIQPGMLQENVADSLGQRRLVTTLLGAFAGIAVLLAVIGIYGAVSYSVAQRTGEIGVRMALGAQTRDVLRLVIRQGMMPVIVGIVAGILAALMMGKLLTAQLYQISAYNPALLGAAAVTLAVVSLVACLFPARRATAVNPIQALRAE